MDGVVEFVVLGPTKKQHGQALHPARTSRFSDYYGHIYSIQYSMCVSRVGGCQFRFSAQAEKSSYSLAPEVDCSLSAL